VIDTNVLYAADDLNDSLCQKASLEQIESVKMGKERIALDKQGYILEEYTRFAKTLDNTSVRKQFVNWLRAYSHTKCLQVDPQPTDNSGVNFSWFPSDPALADFDQDDRKFVATSLAAQKETGQSVPIVNALDSDWCDYLAALQQNDVVCGFCARIECPKANVAELLTAGKSPSLCNLSHGCRL
jgi:hypothetical protein